MQPSSEQPPPAGPAPGPYPAYAYPPAAAPVISKRLIFGIVAFGVLLLWIAQIGIRGFTVSDPGLRTALRALAYTGAAIGLSGSVLGALGSPRTDSWQNLGLLVLAGFFILALIHSF